MAGNARGRSVGSTPSAVTRNEATGGLPLYASADLAAPIDEHDFDPAAYITAFWCAGPLSTARN
jgi:hypothetical protein